MYFVYARDEGTPTARSNSDAAETLMKAIVASGRDAMAEIAVVGKTAPVRRRYWSRKLNTFVDDSTSGSFDWDRCTE